MKIKGMHWPSFIAGYAFGFMTVSIFIMVLIYVVQYS